MAKLIIDPGHGGKDPGGGSNKYWTEKDMNLKISLYQYKLAKYMGIDVTMTRTTDKYLSPDERTKIVRESGAKVCLSNHINAGGGDGAETIHSIYSDGKLAKKIVDEIKEEGQNIRRVFTRKNSRGTDYYYMHRETGKVQTIIIEYGFADSKRDDIGQIKENWIKYAEAVLEAYCEYVGIKFKLPPIGKEEIKAPKGKYYKVQVGAFSYKENAEDLLKELEKKGYKPFIDLE